MSNRFRISPILRACENLGLSRELVLHHAGLPPGTFDQDRALVTTDEFFALFRGLETAGSDPVLGLKLATEARVEHYDPVAIAALYASSLRDALQRMARYKKLTCPEEIRVTERGNECRVQFEWMLAADDEPELLIDVCFAWVAQIARRGTGDGVRPKRIELARPGKKRALFEKHFGCPMKFDARANVLVFELADLARPFVTHNADVLAIVAPRLEAELAEQQSERSFRERVKVTLKKALAGQRPELRTVARELGVSTRTLQRRLTDERITFQELVTEARRELAHHYLRHSKLELNETAYLLGYEDSNSFFRAFQQWEGTTPGEWRSRLAPRPEKTEYSQVSSSSPLTTPS